MGKGLGDPALLGQFNWLCASPPHLLLFRIRWARAWVIPPCWANSTGCTGAVWQTIPSSSRRRRDRPAARLAGLSRCSGRGGGEVEVRVTQMYS